MMKTLLTLLFTFLSCSLFANVNVEKLGEAIAKSRVNLNNSFYCEKLTSEGNKDTYHLVLKEAAPGQKFKLYQFNLLGVHHPALVGEGFIDPQGEALFDHDGQTIKLSNYHFSIGSSLPGEPLYSLIILDGKTHLAASIIPNPIEITDSNNRKVTLELISAHKPKYLVKGSQFKPGEEINLLISTKSKKDAKKLRASKMGNFYYVLESSLKELENGRILVSTSEQDKSLAIAYNWNYLVDIVKKKR